MLIGRDALVRKLALLDFKHAYGDLPEQLATFHWCAHRCQGSAHAIPQRAPETELARRRVGCGPMYAAGR
jgi:hypothetical protein